jgi:hypothetical protein
VAPSICGNALIADLAPSVPAIHAAVPAIETAAAAFRANTSFSHRKALSLGADRIRKRSRAYTSIRFHLSVARKAENSQQPMPISDEWILEKTSWRVPYGKHQS